MMKFASVCSIFGNIGKCLHSRVLRGQNMDSFQNTAKNFKILQPSRRMMQTGRSMIEMLGVSAIIGVLSIAGLWGYQLAIAKHKAIDAHVL